MKILATIALVENLQVIQLITNDDKNRLQYYLEADGHTLFHTDDKEEALKAFVVAQHTLDKTQHTKLKYIDSQLEEEIDWERYIELVEEEEDKMYAEQMQSVEELHYVSDVRVEDGVIVVDKKKFKGWQELDGVQVVKDVRVEEGVLVVDKYKVSQSHDLCDK